MRTLENMPYSLAKSGPKSVDGVGNCELHLASVDLEDRLNSRCHQIAF